LSRHFCHITLGVISDIPGAKIFKQGKKSKQKDTVVVVDMDERDREQGEGIPQDLSGY
jgi:hypothetical protein